MGESKPNQQTTPLQASLSPEETVTIVDPRHPLFGLTLGLLGIENRPYYGRCCVVLFQDKIERNVPLAATDRSPDPVTIYPLPLNLASVRQLLATYECIVFQPAGGVGDGSTSQDANGCPAERDGRDGIAALDGDRGANAAQGGVESTDLGPTAGRVSDACGRVPQPDQALDKERGQ